MNTQTDASCTLNIIHSGGVAYAIPCIPTPHVDMTEDVIVPEDQAKADVIRGVYGGVSASQRVATRKKKHHHHKLHPIHIHLSKFGAILCESIVAVVGAAVVAWTFGAASPAVAVLEAATETAGAAAEAAGAAAEVAGSTTTTALSTVESSSEAALTHIATFGSQTLATAPVVEGGAMSFGSIVTSMTAGLPAGAAITSEIMVATAATSIGECGDGKIHHGVNLACDSKGMCFTTESNYASNLFVHSYDPSQYEVVRRMHLTPAFYKLSSLCQFFNVTPSEVNAVTTQSVVVQGFGTIPFNTETTIEDNMRTSRVSNDLSVQSIQVPSLEDKPTIPDLVGGLLGSTTYETCLNINSYMQFQGEMVSVAASYGCIAPKWI